MRTVQKDEKKVPVDSDFDLEHIIRSSREHEKVDGPL